MIDSTHVKAHRSAADFRRVATRYDRLARNYLASVWLAAALAWRGLDPKSDFPRHAARISLILDPG